MNTSKERDWFVLKPELNGFRRQFVKFCKRVDVENQTPDEQLRSQGLRSLRDEVSLVSADAPLSDDWVKLQLAKSVVLDLASQSWQLKIERGSVEVHSPLLSQGSPIDEKNRVRRGHLIERDMQLSQRATSDFIKDMEQQRLGPTGWHSIFSLMRDGRNLAEKLREASAITDKDVRAAQLAQAISPYIQFIEGDARCTFTGLRLRDIWRYFRLTWVNNYKSVPGRSIMILVRDAAAPNHPIIGIAALASSVVQQKARDKYIGWYTEDFVGEFSKHPSTKVAKRLVEALENLLNGIYLDDLLEDPELGFKRKHLEQPTTELISRLYREAKQARASHQRSPQTALHKSGTEKREESDWEEKARTALFRSKRCLLLATLLSIRTTLANHDFQASNSKSLRQAVESGQVRNSIGHLVRLMKAAHVGIDMMDIVVCGAIAPYNLVLGGKLVCMLLGSPEVVKYYAAKYQKRPSIIASSMKGGPVSRPHNLVLLCTTSLYGVGSSQYNRVKVPAEFLGGRPEDKLEYCKLGYSVGFGSFHFSQETLKWIKVLLGRKANRLVNSIFGEGVNPLMRKIREALDEVGLLSDRILWHGNERVVYTVPLARNFREVLLGIDRRPQYLIPQTNAKAKTASLSEYWRIRWLASRIKTEGIIDKVAEHTLTRPIRHGARVPSANIAYETSDLWQVS
jgi:Druantia protein DruA